MASAASSGFIGTSAVVKAQLESLDDTDCYASVWNDIRLSNHSKVEKRLWGGKGKGGRGLARRTIQPYDVVVDDVRLHYLQGDVCLDKASIKLLNGRKYALCGRNGCGKSTLLQRMHAQKIPGWSTSWSSLYLPPELSSEYSTFTVAQVITAFHQELKSSNQSALQTQIDILQNELDSLNLENDQSRVEQLCEELSFLEEQLDGSHSNLDRYIQVILEEMGSLNETTICSTLSPGQQKRLLLHIVDVIGQDTNLLLLDEPTAHLDISGLLQLRDTIENNRATVVLISHDVDFLNDVATDIIEMQDQSLWYFPGNYDNYRIMKEQQGMSELRQSLTLEKKRGHLMKALDNIKKKPTPKRGGSKKKAKAVSNQRKKLERHEHVENALQLSSTTTSTVATKRGLTAQQRLKLTETLKKQPDKSVHFQFSAPNSRWGEPLITALEIGYSYGNDRRNQQMQDGLNESFERKASTVVKKNGFVFDCVDVCIEEGSRHCICGESAAGKSTLLKVLAKFKEPTEGEVYHAPGIRVGYFDASCIQENIEAMIENRSLTSLQHLSRQFPKKTESDLRGHLSAFGLSPTVQSSTPLLFLSSGEKCRFLLAHIMLENPPILCLDDPTLHFDVESVNALIYGLQHWSGTLILVSSDANFLRSLENVKCSVLISEEGKLRKVEGGIDTYLQSFQILS